MAKKDLAEKSLQKMSRAELVEIIYALQQKEQELLAERDELRQQLTGRNVRINNAGSIAEEMVGLSGIFDTAQAAADRYLAAVYAANADAGARAGQMLLEAEAQSNAIKAQAERDVMKKWSEFERRVEAVLAAYPELREFFKRQY